MLRAGYKYSNSPTTEVECRRHETSVGGELRTNSMVDWRILHAYEISKILSAWIMR